MAEQKTPLYDRHVACDGRIVPFAGYLLPVQYPTGVIAEHKAVREKAGIFDVSHMGEATLEGPDALRNLNYILTNNFETLLIGSARYTLMLYDNGGEVDDLIVYRLGADKFLLVLNASNTAKDIAWLRAHLQGDVTLTDLSPVTAQIALQGPLSKEIITPLCDAALLPEKNYTFTEKMDVAGVPCLVSRTGYTGEFGYELYMAPKNAATVWTALQNAGAVPCGLGCRDTLRLEAAMPLYGHELGEHINPIAAGLGFAIKMNKDDFIGKEALVQQGQPKQTRIGLKVTGRGVIREHESVLFHGEEIGMTTSGTHCPTLGVACAMAYLDTEFAVPGTAVSVSVRGREVAAEVVALPFYKHG
ncbi:MAG: glycine cleavage system aminomethyltransferase GcvT, partial [Ruthenibacterium sp.]